MKFNNESTNLKYVRVVTELKVVTFNNLIYIFAISSTMLRYQKVLSCQVTKQIKILNSFPYKQPYEKNKKHDIYIYPVTISTFDPITRCRITFMIYGS